MIYGGHFDPLKKEKRIKELENKTLESNFWNDKKESEKVIEELNHLKNQINEVSNLKDKINDNISFLEEIKNNYDDELKELIEQDVEYIENKLDLLEIEILLSGKYDSFDAIVELHSGAGGTEACDWTEMLYRMYDRWCNKHNYKVKVIDTQYGDEAGIKSISLIVSGLNAYGYLKSEKGIHRLVRISPFDSNSRRHTSFASVDVTPLFKENNIDIEINENDLRIDVYRSSGKGGQGVNTTDSAVRITHLPTNTVVTCQNERSQIQNKEQALKVLKSRLYELEQQKKLEEAGTARRSKIGTGDRAEKIRTYNYPQNRVTDHRIGYTTKNLDRVMDWDLDDIINALIQEDQKRKLKGETEE